MVCVTIIFKISWGSEIESVFAFKQSLIVSGDFKRDNGRVGKGQSVKQFASTEIQVLLKHLVLDFPRRLFVQSLQLAWNVKIVVEKKKLLSTKKLSSGGAPYFSIWRTKWIFVSALYFKNWYSGLNG